MNDVINNVSEGTSREILKQKLPKQKFPIQTLPMQKLPKAIIFDWDNTIVNMRGIYQNAAKNALGKLKNGNWHIDVISSKHHYSNDIDSIINTLNDPGNSGMHYNMIVTNVKKNSIIDSLNDSYGVDYYHHSLCNKNDIHLLNGVVNSIRPEELWILDDMKLQKDSFHEHIFHGSPIVFHISNDDLNEFSQVQSGIIQDCHNSNIENILLFDGVIDLFNLCLNMNIPMFIVSNKDGNVVRFEAKYLGVDSFFVEIVGANDTGFVKPSIKPVMHALRNHNNIPLSECWFVGDSIFDMQTAKNMNCLGVAVHSRCMSSNTLNLDCTSHIKDVLSDII